jgi:formylglycine-generating enzyme required for sulfatase activity
MILVLERFLMRKFICFFFLLAIIALLAFSSRLPINDATLAGQGKGGEVIAKPTPKPTSTKTSTTKVPPKKNPPAARQAPCSAQMPTQATGRRHAVNLTGGVSLEMLEIPAGSFCMGSNNGSGDEKPVHQVTFSQPFYMGKYEVTRAQWQSVMGSDLSIFKDCGGNCPIDSVSWDEAQKFINKLNENNDGFRYRLPTEAEWEYACRAGTTTEFAFGNSLSSDQANFDGDYPYGGAAKGVSREKPIAVGNFAPNTFGLYDLHGNVSEWCEDWYHSSYNGAPRDGSAWLSSGDQKYRVSRGGSFYGDGSVLRSASRNALITATYIDCSLNCNGSGFRVVAITRT